MTEKEWDLLALLPKVMFLCKQSNFSTNEIGSVDIFRTTGAAKIADSTRLLTVYKIYISLRSGKTSGLVKQKSVRLVSSSLRSQEQNFASGE